MNGRRAAVVVAVLLACTSAIGGCAGSGTEPRVGRTLWRVPLDDHGWGRAPLIAGELLVIPHAQGLRALRLADGAEAWRSEPLRNPALSSALHNLVARDSLVVAGFDGDLVALSATSGKVVWRISLPEDSAWIASETFSDARGIVTSSRATVYDIDPETRAVRWSRNLASAADWFGRGSAFGFAGSGDTLFVTLQKPRTDLGWLYVGVVVALDRRTGAELWRFEGDSTSGDTRGPPLLLGSTVVARDQYGLQVWGLDRGTGALRWRLRTEPTYGGPTDMVVHEGTLLVSAGDTFVYAVDPVTGMVRWRTSTGESNLNVASCGSTVVAQQLGYVILDAGNGRLLARGGEYGGGDFVASGFAVRDGVAYAIGSKYVEAFRCDRR